MLLSNVYCTLRRTPKQVPQVRALHTHGTFTVAVAAQKLLLLLLLVVVLVVAVVEVLLHSHPDSMS
jgi:hypothetical protein